MTPDRQCWEAVAAVLTGQRLTAPDNPGWQAVDVVEWLGNEAYAYIPFEADEAVKDKLDELDRELDGDLDADRARWCGTVPERVEGTVQLRAHGDEHRAVVTTDGERVHVELLDQAQGIAPGQAAVIYDGTRVVGSATIASTRRVGAHA